jgi:hypothetical protein
MRWLVALPLAQLLGCGGDDVVATTPPPPTVEAGPPCAPGELLLDDGSCRAAGLPPDLPPPGPTHPPEAGVPEDACHEGFVHDGEGGCAAIIPAAPCASGLIAVPGDTVCREIAPCGNAPWGDIPLEAGAEFVNAAFVGTSDGSELAPWKTVQEAVNAAAAGDMIAIAAGSYPENVVITQPVRMWGRCPALVEVVGATGRTIEVSAGGTEIHTLAVTGVDRGLYVLAPGGAILDRLWIHDLGHNGIGLLAGTDATSITGTLVERATRVGVYMEAAFGAFEHGEVRETIPFMPEGSGGVGIQLVADARGVSSNGTVSRSYVHQNKNAGVVVVDGRVEVTGTLIADTAPALAQDRLGVGLAAVGNGPLAEAELTGVVLAYNTTAAVEVHHARVTATACTFEHTVPEQDLGFGEGIAGYDASELDVSESVVRDCVGIGIDAFESQLRAHRVWVKNVVHNPTWESAAGGVVGFAFDAPFHIEIDESVIEKSDVSGLTALGADAILRESIVRDISFSPLSISAPGIVAHLRPETVEPAHVLVENTLIERASGYGALVIGSELDLRASVIRDTQVDADGDNGAGLLVTESEAGLPSRATALGTVFEQCRAWGVYVASSELELEASVVRDVEATPRLASWGRGIQLAPADASIRRSRGVLRWSLIEGVHDAGIFAWSADVDIHGVVIRDVEPASQDPRAGHGIVAAGGPEGEIDPARVLVVGSRIEQVRAVGIGADNSELRIIGTLVREVTGTESEGSLGYCMHAQAGSSLDIAWSAAEDCVTAGIHISQSVGSVSDTTVRRVSRRADGDYGDGIVVSLSEASLVRVLVDGVDRAGLSAFASNVTVQDTMLLCSGFDIDSEPFDDVPSSIDDLGGNHCGCPQPDSECQLVSAGLAPPEPIEFQE